MYLNIIIGGLLLLNICLAELQNSAESSVKFHREDVPIFYEYNSLHHYDNNKTDKDVNRFRNKNYFLQRPQQVYKNIQYAPLVLNTKEKEIDVYTTTTEKTDSELSGISETDITTKKHNIEPIVRIFADGTKHILPVTYVGGHNIKVEPTTNKVVYKSDQKAVYGNNFAFPYREAHFSFRGTNQNFYSNDVPEQRQQVTYPPKLMPFTENNKVLNQFRKDPVKDSKILSALENAKLQPVFNPYVKVPRIHINVARSNKIAQSQYKAPGSKRLKFLISKPKQTYLPHTNLLLDQITFK